MFQVCESCFFFDAAGEFTLKENQTFEAQSFRDIPLGHLATNVQKGRREDVSLPLSLLFTPG